MKKTILLMLTVLFCASALSAATLDRISYNYLKPAQKGIPVEIQKLFIVFVTQGKLDYDLKIFNDFKSNPIFSALYQVTGEAVMLVDQAPGKEPNWGSIISPYKQNALDLGSDAIMIIGFNFCYHETSSGRIPLKQNFLNSSTDKMITVSVENPVEIFEPRMLASFNIYDLKSNQVVIETPMYESERMVIFNKEYIDGVTRFRDLKGGLQASQKGYKPYGKPVIDSHSSQYNNKVLKFPPVETVMNKLFYTLYDGVCYMNLPKKDKDTIKLIKFSKSALNKPFKEALKSDNWSELSSLIKANESTLLGTGKSKDVAAYYFNLAMLAEVAGDFATALELLEKAENAETKKVSFADEKTRIEQSILLFTVYPQLGSI